MPINTVAPASGTSGSNQTLNLQDFLKILLTELQFQDPLKPMDNEQFMAQMAQFSTLEQTQQLSSKVDQLLSIQSTSQSVGLLGRTIEISSTGGNVSGQVTSLSLTNGTPTLSITQTNGQVLDGITLSQVVSVH
jgi:flagellar basal-body rod modification protein FlgD